MQGFDFYSACYDYAPKAVLHVEGDGVHSFFDVRGFLKFGTGGAGKHGVEDQIVDMPIETFLGLAEPIPDDDYKRHSASSVDDFVREVKNGKDFGWTIPYLTLRKNEDDRWKVVGHDGRHRATLLKKVGYNTMPVHLVFEGGLSPEGKGQLPKELWCQNDCAKERAKYVYPFPIDDDNYGEAYIKIDREMEKPEIPSKTANVKDEATIKFKALCPKANEVAKSNYEKDPEPNPYKRDCTVPYETFGEFLKKQDKLQVGREERGTI